MKAWNVEDKLPRALELQDKNKERREDGEWGRLEALESRPNPRARWLRWLVRRTPKAEISGSKKKKKKSES